VLPESLIMTYFCWGVTIVVLILSDAQSLEKSWPNAKMKWIAILFSITSVIVNVLPQRFDIQNTSTTVVYYNQTVGLSPPGVGGLNTPLDFTRFIVSLLLAVLSAVDLLITFMEDPL